MCTNVPEVCSILNDSKKLVQDIPKYNYKQIPKKTTSNLMSGNLSCYFFFFSSKSWRALRPKVQAICSTVSEDIKMKNPV